MSKGLKNLLKTILFFSLGLVILFFVFKNQEKEYLDRCLIEGIAIEDCSLVKKIWGDFKSVNPFWILLSILAFLLSNISRAWRWKYLLETLGKPVKLSNTFWSISLGYLANLGIPRSGEILRPATLARNEDIPFEKVMGTVVVDRLIDMFSFLVVLALGLLFSFNFLWDYLTSNAQIPIHFKILSGIGLIAFILFLLLWKDIKKSEHFLIRKIVTFLEGILDGVSTILKVKKKKAFVIHSIIIWVLYFMMTWLAFYSFQPTAHLGAKEALLTFIFGSLGMIIPTPGGVGSYQILVTTCLQLFDISGSDALSFSFIIFFALNIFVNILFGLISLIALPLINKK